MLLCSHCLSEFRCILEWTGTSSKLTKKNHRNSSAIATKLGYVCQMTSSCLFLFMVNISFWKCFKTHSLLICLKPYMCFRHMNRTILRIRQMCRWRQTFHTEFDTIHRSLCSPSCWIKNPCEAVAVPNSHSCYTLISSYKLICNSRFWWWLLSFIVVIA